MKIVTLTTLLLTALSTNVWADSVIGTAVGYGAQQFDLNSETIDGDEFNVDIYYRYMLNQNIGFEGGWQAATGGIGSFMIEQISEIKDANYSGPRVATYLQYPIFNANYIYTKLGVNRYTLDYTLNDVSKSASDLGLEASLGLESRFDSGLGLNFEYRIVHSSFIKANQWLVGVSYQW